MPKLDAVVLARSTDGGATVAARASVGDAAAAPYFMHPQIAGEAGGALDLGLLRRRLRRRPERELPPEPRRRSGGPFAPSVAVSAPVAFLSARADPRWVGDYPGVFALGSALYMGYVVNAGGEAHVAFAKADAR